MPSKKPKTPKQSPQPQQQAEVVATAPSPTTVTICPSFHPFAALVAKGFRAVTAQPQVFVADIATDALYAAYIAAFPDGFNPVVKARTEHDCATCRQFIRRVGNVVAAPDENGFFLTIWDLAAATAQHPFNVVATRLRDLVSAAAVSDIFRVSAKETSYGAEQTRTLLQPSGVVQTFNHFYTGEIPQRFRVASPDAERGEYRTTVQVFQRGLEELSGDAVETVLSLIDGDNLYRGAEHRSAVVNFQHAQRLYRTSVNKSQFAWLNAHLPAARFRNNVIGTLVTELSEGKDTDAAVRAFESKVAPQNYKRTSAVITPSMVKAAMAKITELGLESALERRFAVIGDVSVRDVLWVDGITKNLMKGGIGDVLMQHAAAVSTTVSNDEKHAEIIKVDDFVATVLPSATAMEMLFKGEHVGNLMALTAPVSTTSARLFRWDNDFAWSYCGNVADSIKERVKKAGGKVEGATLRVSLSWYNFDDLDLHIIEPHGRGMAVANQIYFANRTGWTGGTLDVDMNAGGGTTREPVENIVWSQKIPDGAYRVVVHNFSQRELSNVGFVVEVEHAGKLLHYSYNKPLSSRNSVIVAILHVLNGVVVRIEAGDPAVTAANISQEKWVLCTEMYAKVNAVTLSPNYWHPNAVGNKHTFFVLDGCRSDEDTRGIYNEFLHSRLEPHRKVFEVIGNKTKCVPTDGALCGLGFSSTKRDSVVVRVTSGKKRRTYSVQF